MNQAGGSPGNISDRRHRLAAICISSFPAIHLIDTVPSWRVQMQTVCSGTSPSANPQPSSDRAQGHGGAVCLGFATPTAISEMENIPIGHKTPNYSNICPEAPFPPPSTPTPSHFSPPHPLTPRAPPRPRRPPPQQAAFTSLALTPPPAEPHIGLCAA